MGAEASITAEAEAPITAVAEVPTTIEHTAQTNVASKSGILAGYGGSRAARRAAARRARQETRQEKTRQQMQFTTWRFLLLLPAIPTVLLVLHMATTLLGQRSAFSSGMKSSNKQPSTLRRLTSFEKYHLC